MRGGVAVTGELSLKKNVVDIEVAEAGSVQQHYHARLYIQQVRKRILQLQAHGNCASP